MESIITMGNHENQLTNSVEEVDPHEPHVGSGARSYECMFCRRGFTTAQALGGHMNIHRKDRAKNRHNNYLSNNNSNQQEDHSFYANTGFCPQSYMSQSTNNQEENNRYTYTPCFLSGSSSFQPVNHENKHQADCQVIMSPSREEKMMSLSLQFGWSHGEDHREPKRRSRERSNEDELDLELRLGHDP